MHIDKFWMPRKRAVQAIIDSGRAFARDAEALKRQFIDHGLPETFIDDLNRAVHDVERAMLDQSVSRGSRAAAIAGFNDTLNEALTLLERFEVSATVFIAAHFVDRKQEFFWDELERILLSPGRLPPRIRIVVASGTFELDLQEIADYPETEQRRYRHWSVLEQKAPTPRQSLYRNFCCFVRDLTPCEREDALSQLRAWASTPADARDSHRTLTSPEVRQLQDGGLIEIGAHTLTHPVLSRLRADEQRLEIAGSREKLEAIVSRPVHSFSYPFGSPDDYTEDTARIVREAGFECACSNFCRRVSSKTHRFHLPRMLVRDWNGREFEERLTACFRA